MPALKKEMDVLPKVDVTETLQATIAHQQKALESLQYEQRSKNLIITGVPEADGSSKEAREKDALDVNDIMIAAACPGVVPTRVVRLGKKQDNQVNADGTEVTPRPRPLLVVTKSASEVSTVLRSCRKLKDTENYESVYVKRDEHPLIRKEWGRLRGIARTEKNAPINQGCTIKVDYRLKAVTKDGHSIAQFVSPFRLGGPSESD